MRFHIIEQVPLTVKKDPESGEIMEQYTDQKPDMFFMPYQGSMRRIQCALCGMIENEDVFINMAKKHPHFYK